ncbi:MAG TPA: cyanophycin synthetase [Rubrobacter sp.]|jgi:dihydrofolate synthase/folylpolyglutamate synthase|nr:cyanophycin synthetase [Rubrobacter sp.]
MTSFAQVCAELDRRRYVTLGFERIEALLTAMGHPEGDVPGLVQVVGTNGKGTTALALAAALQEMGYPSGAYLSPHVLSYTERVVLRGDQVSEEDFAAAMSETIELADSNGIPASQFELLTAGALGIFAASGLSWAVLEAGLGARHDATSVVRPDAVVLTNVSMDHTEYLGETVEEIAEEKLASLRPGATLFLGTDKGRIINLAHSTCRRLGARLVLPGEAGENIPFPGLAPYAADDVRLGIAVAESLLGRSLPTEVEQKVALAILETLPGRFEVHEVEGVPVVVDGGHNAAGLSAALAGMHAVYGKRPLGVVFGVLREKDATSMLAGLKGEANAIVLTRPESERAADPAQVEHALLDRGERRALVVEDPVEALGVAVKAVREAAGVVLVTGSLSTAAPVLRWLREA